MFYEIMCLVIAAFGAYGFYTAISRLLAGRRLEGDFSVARGIHVQLGFSEEELDEALFLLREEAFATGEEPVLLIDCSLRDEALRELRGMGAELYLSYEEYCCEKRK